ncbi:MAG: pantoate--beta-alanine ligase [Sandaracinaceae bacterium]|nr:pantoate--beta-alanine ligase [Sandaracinaceae bacterium]
MEVLHEPARLRAVCDQARRAGERVGVVPTMGALHAGHLALIDEARRRGAQRVVVTIFVNPLQFGPNEDYSRYPRTLPDDAAACEARGVDWVFAPDREAMYPAGFASQVRVSGVTEVLEGVFRPGHFDGVTTVVAKLFGLVGDAVAVFGRKDYQQWCVLRRMVRDLDLPIEMHGMPTVREVDGLALSSRNRYLSPEERVRALAIVRGLRAAIASFDAGERDPRVLESMVRAPVEAAFDRIDYVAVADADSLAPIERVEGRAVLAVAAHLGRTRLIDNVVLGEDRP